MTPEQIDAFLALEGKHLEPGSPTNMANLAPEGRCDSLYKVEVQHDHRSLGVWMKTMFTFSGLPDYVLTLGNNRPFMTIVHSPTGIFRGHIGRDGGSPSVGRIEGSRYYSWNDNRALFPKGTAAWSPQVARELPRELTSYKKVVRWVCRQANITVPDLEQIFRPRGVQ